VPVTWPFEPTVYAGLILMWVGYVWLAWRRLDTRARPFYFLAGLAVVWAALQTPIDSLGDRYLQSLHMFQHVLLAMVAPPLLVLGLSPAMATLLTRWVPALRSLCAPVPAQLAAAAVMVAWHVPFLYDLTARSEPVHVLEHVMFMVSGVALWWPLLEGTAATLRTRLGEGGKVIYLLIATVPQDGVALVLQFSRQLFYSQYALTPALVGGWTPVIDQNVAGAILQLFGKVAFAVLLVILFFRWLEPEHGAAAKISPPNWGQAP
jgi:cytochrome c oxidase assembly factor CtaG